MLNTNVIHLRSGDIPEWDWFTNAPDARRLDLKFSGKANSHEATLFIRQDDVRQDWRVELNGKRLGSLFLMEADVVHALRIPPATLRDRSNTLSIVPPRENDDIVLREIRIDDRPLAEAIGESTLDVTVADSSTRGGAPGRVTVVDSSGALAALHALTNAAFTVRPGVIYTGDGRARVGLPAGDYTVYASRGFEWSVATQRVHVASGGTAKLALRIRREVDTRGLVSCDTHVHTFTYSRHGDATLDERMLTLAGEGIELPIATDHNLNIDYTEPARRMKVGKYFTPVPGDEVTTTKGHFNIFPTQPGARVPDYKIPDWPRLMEEMRAAPGVRVVVLNHPRNIHNGFQPFARTNYNDVTGENKRGFEFSFDATELVNSSALQSDYMLVLREWMALLNYGYRVTGVGSSDCHDVSRYIVGQGRTYIACDDARPNQIDIASACSNLLAGRATVSCGLLATMRVNGKFQIGDLATNLPKEIVVTVRVLGPSWITATNVELYANGTLIRQTAITNESSRGAGEKAAVGWTIPKPAHDVHLVAIATGPGVTAPFWAGARPYQPSSPHWEPRVIAVTNPIRVDADGDGKFTSARAYAMDLMITRSEPAQVIAALKMFDEAVAAEAASILKAGGVDLDSLSLQSALDQASPAARRGFARFKETQQ